VVTSACATEAASSGTRNLENDLSIRREGRHAEIFGSDQDREGGYQVSVASGDPMGHDEPVAPADNFDTDPVGRRVRPGGWPIP
jgi:hypothetical protein